MYETKKISDIRSLSPRLGAIKASAADFVAQKSSASAPDSVKTTETVLSYKRNLAFFLYGGLYLGMFQEFLFNGVYPRIFGGGTGIITAAKTVFLDIIIIYSSLGLSMAYILKALVFRETFMEGFRRYVNDVKNNNLITKCWQLWVPVQFITFTVIPTHFRTSFVAFVSFFWMIMFSSVANKGE